jgi:hypothetical protein
LFFINLLLLLLFWGSSLLFFLLFLCLPPLSTAPFSPQLPS